MNATTHTAPDFAKAAAVYAERFGLRPIPVTPNAKKPPVIREWQRRCTTDAATIASWWESHPTANVAIVPHASQFVLDVDCRTADGFATLRQLEEKHGRLPDTWSAVTPSGGVHYWFALPEGVRVGNLVGFLPGLDTRSDGGFVVAPPSIRPEGQYQWEVRPNDCPLATAPFWLVELVRVKTEDQVPSSPQEANGTHAAEGCPARILRKLLEDAEEAIAAGSGRNDSLFRILTQARDNGATKAQAELLARDFVKVCERHPRPEVFPWKEAAATLGSVFTRPPRQAWEDNAVGITIAASEANPDTGTQPDWGPPRPLDAPPDVPPLPASVLRALPDWCLDLVLATADATESAEDLSFLALLAALSAACLGKLEVMSFQRYRPQPLNVYALGVAPPGGGKSEALRAFTAPLETLESERLVAARKAYAKHVAERKVLEIKRSALEKQAAKGDTAAMEELVELAQVMALADMPPPRARILSQATPEAIAEAAAAGEGCFALLTAEPEGLGQLLPSYREGARLVPEVILSGFDAARFTQARVAEGRSREIDRCNGTLLVLAQGEQLARVLSEPSFRESGFLSRCLLSVPRLPAKSGDPREGLGVPDRTARTYAEHVVALGRWLSQFTHPVRISFSGEALAELATLHREMAVRRDSESGDLHPLAAVTIRIEQVAARSAALIHLARHGQHAFEQPIEGDIAAAVVELGRYHAAHAVALLADKSPALDLAGKILALALGHGTRCEWRHVQQKCKGRRGWAHVEEAVALLEERNLARVVQESASGQGGRPKLYLETNPALCRPR